MPAGTPSLRVPSLRKPSSSLKSRSIKRRLEEKKGQSLEEFAGFVCSAFSLFFAPGKPQISSCARLSRISTGRC